MANRGGHAAEFAMHFFGSWRFIIGQTFVVAVWIASNLWAYSHHWDPYPFILLNLAFSTQAAYAAPLILIAQNRLAANDREAASADRRTNLAILELSQQNKDILEFLRGHLAPEVDYLVERNGGTDDSTSRP
jgi:uncharacterized membrane protein